MNFTAQATPQSKLPPDIFRAPPHKLSGTVFPIGKVDVSAIRELLATKTEAEWQENAMRQQNFTVHRHTESLVLKWCANSGADTPVETTRHYADFEPLLRPIMEQIHQAYGYERPVIRKAMFAKLKAGGQIPDHCDGAVALRMVHRIHIPIITNDQVHFLINDIDHSMKVGEIAEIDNTRFHSVRNDSQEDRIHLIIDYYHA